VGWQATPQTLSGTSGQFQLTGNPSSYNNQFTLYSGTSQNQGQIPSPWIVTPGVHDNWSGGVFVPANNQTALDPLIAANNSDLTQGAITNGTLSWRPNFSSVDYTGSNNPDSVDFYEVEHQALFEGGYGVRWIYSTKSRQVNVNLKSQTFSGNIYLIASMNGATVYQGLISTESNGTKVVTASLNQGWNTLVFRISHFQWLWQAYVGLSGTGSDTLSDLIYSADYYMPATPTPVTMTPGSSGILLQWPDNSNNETGFEIQRRAANGSWAAFQTVATNTTSYNDTTVLPGVIYQYRVRANALGANSPWATTNSLQYTSVAAVAGPVWSPDSVVFYQDNTSPGSGYVPTGLTYNPPSSSFVPFVTGQTLYTPINTTTGWLGMEITVGAVPIAVQQVGRWVMSGNTAAHTVKLVNAATNIDVPGGSASVVTAGASVGFKYAALAAPVTLAANTAYYLLSQETAGGDYLYNGNSGLTSGTAVAKVTNSIWVTGAVHGGYGPNTCYGPLAFTYSLTPSAAFITGHNMTSLRNDITGWLGMKITVGASDIVASQLGRWVVAGNTGAHVVKLVNATTGADLASATVATLGATAGQFQYAPLTAAVTLAANTSYYLLSQETAGGDQWYQVDQAATGTATGYQLWLLANGLPMDESGAGSATANLANDGLSNLMKCALGLTPYGNGNGGRLSYGSVPDTGGNYLSFTYIRPEPAPAGISYIVEASPDLKTWSATGLVQISSTLNAGLRTVTLRDSVPMAPLTPRFMRLRVTK
jgi:hypothetical protein